MAVGSVVRSPSRAYVSTVALDWAEAEPERRWRSSDATACLVDISGFTALSERLARRGRLGAEELTGVLNAVFTELLSVAHEQRGVLVKFGGDALLLLFDGPDHPGRACWAAVGMRTALHRVGRVVTDAGTIRLRMSVGVHTGSFHLFRVGTTHRELIVAGPAVSDTARLEGKAGPGEILVSRTTAAEVEPRLLGAAKMGGRLLRDLRRLPPGLEPLRRPPADPAIVRGELPVSLRTHLASGEPEPEHRSATVGFVGFGGTDRLVATSGPEAVAEVLQALVTIVQEATEEEQVAFLGSDIAADGGKFILTAGVPVVHEDDEGRLLRALLTVIDAGHHARLPVALRAGAHRGHVFAADVGAPHRRTYTVIGDTVNLAARLMGRAPMGHVYCTGEVVERSRSRFVISTLDPVTVKGKSTPVRMLDVQAVAGSAGPGSPVASLPFTGRDAELARLKCALDDADAGREGGAIQIVGAAGVGKSRLVTELLSRVDDRRVAVVHGELFGTNTPYLPVRLLLRELLAPEPSNSDALASALADAVVSSAPHLEPWVPLIGTVIGVDLPPTDATAALDPEFTGERREIVTAELLLSLLGERVLFVVEDAHWLDEPSAALLRRLAVEGTVCHWLVLSTTRPPGGAEAGVVTIELEPLADDDARRMVQAATETSPLRPHELELVVERAAGNPLFLDGILRARAATGDVASLPDSLDAVATATIDLLPAPARRLLRCASVLGLTFRRDVLADVVGEALGDAAWTPLVDELIEDGPGLLRFRTHVVRDAAYEGLSYRRRRELHLRAGRVYERRYSDRLDDYVELLSFHFAMAGRHEEAWYYARRAGGIARAAYANVEAVTHLQRAVEAGRRLRVNGVEMAGVLEQLGDACLPAGFYRPAMDAFREAGRLCEGRVVDEARLLFKRSHTASFDSPLDAQLRLARRARRHLDGCTGREAQGLRARVLVREAAVRHAQGRLAESLRLCQQAVDEATDAGEQRAMADAYGLLDALYVDTGQPEKLGGLDRALELYRAMGDRYWEGTTLMNLGVRAYYEGDWARVEDLHRQGMEALTAAGGLTQAAFAAINMAEVLISQGRLDEAEVLLTNARRVTRAASYHEGAGFACQQLGRLYARRGDHRLADEHFGEARTEYLSIGYHRAVIEMQMDQIEALLLRGDLNGADSLLAATRPEIDRDELTAKLVRLDALSRVGHGDIDGALDGLTSALATARLVPIERFRILQALLGLGITHCGADLAGWRAERDELASRLCIR